MCMVDYSDPVNLLDAQSHTARKKHKCNECWRVIVPGEIYLREHYIFDGEFHTHKTCAHCRVVRDWLQKECGGWIYTKVEEDIREHAQEGYGWRVKLMAAGMARNWKRRDGRMWPIPKLPKLSFPEQNT